MNGSTVLSESRNLVRPVGGGSCRSVYLLEAGYLIGLLFLLVLSGCVERPPKRPYLSPSLDVVVTGSESTLCVHRDGKVEYVLYNAAPFKNWSWNGASLEIEEPHLWNEHGHIELYRTDREVEVQRDGAKPNLLSLNGSQFELSRGRVFRITDSQTFDQKPLDADAIETIKFDQIPLDTVAIKSDVDLELFSEKLLDYLSKR